jgi:protocatechuate 3,4-dioxygenase beta subunit
MYIASHLAAVLATLGAVTAHPGHDLTQEVAERRDYTNSVRSASLAHCADHLAARGVLERNIARRSARVAKEREARGLAKRDIEDVLNTDHDKSELGYTPDTGSDIIFGANASCVLTPEVTEGPYYVGGEYVRENIIEDEEGVNIVLDFQVIDVDTCEPIPDVYVEIWQCNSTGVYGGVSAQGNGNTADLTNLDNTALRGIQPADADGVAVFESLFPGHYVGRTTHIHIMVHTNATLLANDTIGNDIYASHIGQAFFDQKLITEVEKLAPYTSNTQPLTTNANDFIMAQEAAIEGSDPVMAYTYLGNGVSDGLFAWLAFGINTTYTTHIEPAVNYYEGGGEKNPDAGSGFPGFPGGGN